MTYHSSPMTETVFYVVPTIAENLVRAGLGQTAVRDQLVRPRPPSTRLISSHLIVHADEAGV